MKTLSDDQLVTTIVSRISAIIGAVVVILSDTRPGLIFIAVVASSLMWNLAIAWERDRNER